VRKRFLLETRRVAKLGIAVIVHEIAENEKLNTLDAILP